MTAGPGLVDLDRIDGDLTLAWKAYQAAWTHPRLIRVRAPITTAPRTRPPREAVA